MTDAFQGGAELPEETLALIEETTRRVIAVTGFKSDEHKRLAARVAYRLVTGDRRPLPKP